MPGAALAGAVVIEGREASVPFAFQRAFERQQARAYSWDLWGAAFQRWLISKGRVVFEAALADPDSLADLLEPDAEGLCAFEEFVASDVWAEKRGQIRKNFRTPGLLRRHRLPARPSRRTSRTWRNGIRSSGSGSALRSGSCHNVWPVRAEQDGVPRR